MWARMAAIALPKAGTAVDGDGFYKAKLATARFFFDRMLPETSARLSAIMAGGDSLMALDEAAF
jgi:butyryl-CoA dehydrogenase